MHPVLEALTALLILAGAAFALIGSWGLVRLPTLMTRLHGPTKATTLGVGCCLIGSMLYFTALTGHWSGRELLITLFLAVTAPVSANMIAKAHLHRQRHHLDRVPPGNTTDGEPPEPPDAAWATFGTGHADRSGAPAAAPNGEVPNGAAPNGEAPNDAAPHGAPPAPLTPDRSPGPARP